jgi:hypothetical protein
MRVTRRATRDQVTNPNNEQLADGTGGTITGGPMEPIGLLEILERAAHGASRGGAVSGAAQGVADAFDRTNLAERGIALSDGSRICFASIADVGLFRDDDLPVARGSRPPGPEDRQAPTPKDGKPQATADSKARTAGTHRARALVSV